MSAEILQQSSGAESAGRCLYPAPDAVRQSKGEQAPGALIVDVLEDSPAYDAGFEPGCLITSVNGKPLRDIIDWRWETACNEISLGYVDLDGEAGTLELEKDDEETWGFSFEGALFDKVKECRNACTFCFMRQLPQGLRPSLTLRDDDFRLSFLSGTFVTCTNITPEDEARIIEQHISPLRVSLHAYDAQARKTLMGKHAPHGLEVIERLLAAGIQMHAQIVLVPEVNDGEVLRQTLAWAYAHPGILELGIVPLGFTRYQNIFDHSFNTPSAAQAVLDLVAPFQKQALEERGHFWVYAADEFYRNAYGADVEAYLPSSEAYGDFGMFEDGVGIIRSFLDDWHACQADGTMEACAQALRQAQTSVCFVVGGAMQPFLDRLVEESPLAGLFVPCTVNNEFFGGNVDVTGLLTGSDISRALAALPQDGKKRLYVIPEVVLNDDAVLLDDWTLEQVSAQSGCNLQTVPCDPAGFLAEIPDLLGK